MVVLLVSPLAVVPLDDGFVAVSWGCGMHVEDHGYGWEVNWSQLLLQFCCWLFLQKWARKGLGR